MATLPTLNLPPNLVFFVSNLGSLVNLKLDPENYMLWQLQMRNALKANQLLGYVEGSIPKPDAEIQDESGQLVPNPALSEWLNIDSQLVSCLNATISSSILPQVIGLEHARDIWSHLENRYASHLRSHVHEIKLKLLNASKEGSMDSYLDFIKNCADRLAAQDHL